MRSYGDGQVVAASELSDLASVSERSTHDNGLVTVLLVVVEDALDGGDTGVLLLGVVLLGAGLEPIKDTADEGGDEESVGLGGGDGLGKGEHEGQVAVDAVVALEDLSGLDALPGGGDLDQDTLLADTLLLVELYFTERRWLVSSVLIWRLLAEAYLDDAEGLVDGGLGVEGESGVNLGGDLAGDDGENLTAELDQQAVESVVDLAVEVATLLLAVGDGGIDQLGVLGLLGGGQDERRVGGGILGLVLANGCWNRGFLISFLFRCNNSQGTTKGALHEAARKSSAQVFRRWEQY